MSSVRSRSNKSTELVLLSIMKANRIRGWRRHPSLPGRPDFAFKSAKLAIFVDGCFWHGCPRCYRPPKHNSGFWAEKVSYNESVPAGTSYRQGH
jgi:DNA mismatch endonuclease, patch repair protein